MQKSVCTSEVIMPFQRCSRCVHGPQYTSILIRKALKSLPSSTHTVAPDLHIVEVLKRDEREEGQVSWRQIYLQTLKQNLTSLTRPASFKENVQHSLPGAEAAIQTDPISSLSDSLGTVIPTSTAI